MAYVITYRCWGEKDGACVEACPVDCIHPREGEGDQPILFINPEECLHCGLCEPMCPTGAIFAEEDLPPPLKIYKEINADYYRLPEREFEQKWREWLLPYPTPLKGE